MVCINLGVSEEQIWKRTGSRDRFEEDITERDPEAVSVIRTL
jgi:hypothetical protein